MESPPPAPLGAASPLPAHEIALATVLSAGLLLCVWFQWLPPHWTITMTESLAFVTGGICVWLVVREHLWNWPIGLANNVFFFCVFFRAGLFADMWLQVVYFALGIWGWRQWLHGGANQSELRVSRSRHWEWEALAVAIPLASWGFYHLLVRANGSAPLWDSITTVLSLAAQYLLCQKRLENWFLWMLADIIYIPLYWSRELYLTSVLYFVFLCLCGVGYLRWRKVAATLESPLLA